MVNNILSKAPSKNLISKKELGIKGEIELFKQNIFNIILGNIDSKSEVLTRYNCISKDDNIHHLGELLKYIEDNNLHYKFDLYIFEKFLQNRYGIIDCKKYSINFYPQTIEDPNFIKDIEYLLLKYKDGINIESLIFEILEKKVYIKNTTKLEDIISANKELEKIQEVINYFKKKYGISFSIDDFPQGGNNFFLIQRLKNIDYLKIDGEYFTELYEKDKESFISDFNTLLEGIFLNHPDIQIVVERIENKEMFEVLKMFDGVIYSQGYFHHKPDKL